MEQASCDHEGSLLHHVNRFFVHETVQVTHSNELLILGAFSPLVSSPNTSCAFDGFLLHDIYLMIHSQLLADVWGPLGLYCRHGLALLSHPAFQCCVHAFLQLCNIYCWGIWQPVIGCYFRCFTPPHKSFYDHAHSPEILI